MTELRKRVLDFQTLFVLEQIFPLDLQAEAERILAEGINTESPEKLNNHTLNRIRLGVLKLSDGNIGKLKEAIELAQKDWRDVLMCAGFAETVASAEIWAKPIREKAPDDKLAKFRLLIRSICMRPAMYVGVSNFNMVHSYIYGYVSGLSASQNGEIECKHMSDFRVWCAEKFGTCRGHDFAEPIRKIAKDDDEAFEQLFLLHEEFYREQLKAKQNLDA